MVNFLNESNAQALSVVTYGMSLLVTNKFGKLNYKKKNIFSGSHIHHPPPQLYQSGRHLPPLHFHWSYKLHESLFKKSNSLFSKEIFIFWSLAHSSSIMTNIRLRRSRWGHSISKMPTVIRRKKVFFFIVPLTLAPRLVTHDFILRFLRFWDFWDFLFFWYFF